MRWQRGVKITTTAGGLQAKGGQNPEQPRSKRLIQLQNNEKPKKKMILFDVVYYAEVDLDFMLYF